MQIRNYQEICKVFLRQGLFLEGNDTHHPLNLTAGLRSACCWIQIALEQVFENDHRQREKPGATLTQRAGTGATTLMVQCMQKGDVISMDGLLELGTKQNKAKQWPGYKENTLVFLRGFGGTRSHEVTARAPHFRYP